MAKKAADVYEAHTDVIGLILHKHGIFPFGDSAEDAYERMIEMVSLAEARLRRGRRAVFATTQLPQVLVPLADAAPLVRCACDHQGPLALMPPQTWRTYGGAAGERAADVMDNHQRYFARHNPRCGGAKKM